MTDIEMKDSKVADEKKTEKTQPEEPTDQFYGKQTHYINNIDISSEMKKSLVLLEKAANDKDFRICASLTKNLKKLRKMCSLSDSLLILKHYLPDLFNRLKLAA
jgi:hypothetical protein